MPSSYRSPPPSYTSNNINSPPSYSSRAQQSNRHSSSYLSGTVSSTSDCSSETSTSRTVSSTSYPSSGTSDSSSSSSSSRSHLHHHSHFHNHNHSHYNTSDGCLRPANSPINAGTSEATPLLKPTTSDSSTSHEKNETCLGIATLIFVALTWAYCNGLFFKSDLTSFWVDITPAPTCHAVGVREYTATLAGKPDDWGHIQACQKTPFVVHGKPVNVTPSCNLFNVPANDTTTSSRDMTVVQGRWLVDFDESDCQPVWSPIETDLCVAPGRRLYHAELDYVPPGLDPLTSCRDAPAVIHGRSVFSDRCEVVLKHGEGTGDDTLVARGYWEIDFSEPYCEVVWTSVTDLHCQTYDRRRYTAILELPWELDPLETCYQFPLWLSGSYRIPETCEQEDGHGRVVGSWFVGSPECRPVLKNIRDYGCMESGFKRVEGEPVDFGRYEDWYPICTTIPLHWLGQTYLPEQCEARTSWFHTRRYAMYKIPAPECP